VEPASAQYSAQGQTGTFRVIPPSPDARWTASTAALWVRLDSGVAQAGLATLSYTLEPNTSKEARVATINVGLNKHTITQAGAAGNSAPAILSFGVRSAAAFGSFQTISPGSWMEIYGNNLGLGARTWAGADFNGSTAPTSLEGTSVSIGGQRAFVQYVSPTQVNAQVPSNVPVGMQPLVVTTRAGNSTAYTVAIEAVRPGLLAPSSFHLGSRQYVAALHADGATFALPPGYLERVPVRRARPGDVLTMYGIGFGPVTPDVPAGQISQGATRLVQQLRVFFRDREATITYAGLAPNTVGLYQFNVVVPDVPGGEAVPLTFRVGELQGSQTLVLPVQN
jgi:uncharacterized protein (TIGR03437 family)